jgi:hypothetical protein
MRTAIAGSVVAALGLFTGLDPAPGGASSHREAPLIAADPQVDTTDLYVFRSPDKKDTVTMISAWIPFEEPAGGPNFYPFAPGARYDFNVDNDGDARPDIIYRFEFSNHYRSTETFLYNTGQVTSLTDPDLNFFQTYDLRRIVPGGSNTLLLDDAIAVPSDVGDTSMPDYAALRSKGTYSILDGKGKALAGQADDPFFLDLRVFDLLYGASLCPPSSLHFCESGSDTLAGFNVNTLALQIPRSDLALNRNPARNPVIGVWATAERRSTRVQNSDGTQSFSGSFVEVSRLGMPLVNEVVIPVGDKDKWNGSKPVDDLANFGSYITDPELPNLIQAVYGVPAPATPRNDLVTVFATGIPGLNQLTVNKDVSSFTPSEMIRLNMSTGLCGTDGNPACSPLGVIGGDPQGYPNGRRLSDDTIDISLRVVEGWLVGQQLELGDAVDANEVSFGDSFPYIALPHSGSVATPHMRVA